MAGREELSLEQIFESLTNSSINLIQIINIQQILLLCVPPVLQYSFLDSIVVPSHPLPSPPLPMSTLILFRPPPSLLFRETWLECLSKFRPPRLALVEGGIFRRTSSHSLPTQTMLCFVRKRGERGAARLRHPDGLETKLLSDYRMLQTPRWK